MLIVFGDAVVGTLWIGDRESNGAKYIILKIFLINWALWMNNKKEKIFLY